MNDFEKIFSEMGIDRALLPVLFKANRSTIHKYLTGEVAVPASAMSMIQLLQLVQKRSPELFEEWAVISDFNVPSDIYLNDENYWKGWTWAQHKLHPKVLQYLKEKHPEVK